MALTIQSPGTLATSSQNGTSISVPYPAGASEGEKLLLIIGMKPSVANGGSITTPSDWNYVGDLIGGGGYGTTLGADTGNTNLFVCERTVPAGGLSGSLSVSVSANNICWAQMERITASSGVWDSVAIATGWDNTGNASVSVACQSNPGVTAGDAIFTAFCCPTDAITGFSAYGITQTGVTFGTRTQMAYADSGTGNDIGGFIASCLVSSGTATSIPTITATAAGTLTNVRGPGVFIRVREAADTTDDLTATGIAAGSPVAGTPTIGQAHALTATGIAAGSPVAGTPTIGQAHALTATGIAAGSPVVGTPALVQLVTHNLSTAGLAAGSPVVGQTALGQTHALTATAIAAGAPTVGAPAVGQKHALTATGLVTSAPSLGTPAVGQNHALTATGLAISAPTLGTPVLGQVFALTANGLTAGAPALGTPALTQRAGVNALTATSLATAAPIPGAPALGQKHAPTATGIAAGSPVVGTPSLGQKHTLTATGIAAGAPTVDLPTAGQAHALLALGLAFGAPVLGTPEAQEQTFRPGFGWTVPLSAGKRSKAVLTAARDSRAEFSATKAGPAGIQATRAGTQTFDAVRRQ